jgi:predicted nucleic acid-binding protein
LALILDTGPLFAAYDRSDNAHTRCRDLLASTDEELLIPAPVLVEFDWLCSNRKVVKGPQILLDDILAGAYTVVSLTTEDHARCRELLAAYEDSDIGWVDASVLAITERLKEPKLATLDHRHFRMLRPRHVEALILCPD